MKIVSGSEDMKLPAETPSQEVLSPRLENLAGVDSGTDEWLG